MKRSCFSILAIAILALSANSALAANWDPRVRVVHASPDAPGVDILVNDSLRAFTDIEFGEVSDYAEVPANIYNVKVPPAGGMANDAVIDADLNLFYDTDYTVVALDFLENIKPIVLIDDNGSVPFRRTKVRFVHASPDAPAVDIKIVDGPYLFQNIAFTEFGDYVTFPSGIYSLEVRVAGTDAVALELPGVWFQRGATYTVFATGLVGGQPSLGVVLSEDARNSSAGWGSYWQRYGRWF
jgi:hypothetical protein